MGSDSLFCWYETIIVIVVAFVFMIKIVTSILRIHIIRAAKVVLYTSSILPTAWWVTWISAHLLNWHDGTHVSNGILSWFLLTHASYWKFEPYTILMICCSGRCVPLYDLLISLKFVLTYFIWCIVG